MVGILAEASPAERAELKKYWPKSTKQYVKKIFGEKLLDYQENVYDVIDDNQRIAISACHNVGKTFLLGRYVAKEMSTIEDVIIVTTAPTFNQVKNLLWAEIRAAAKKSKIKVPGTLNLTEWRVSEKWYAIGFSPKKEAVSVASGESTASGFQGFHSKKVIVVFDEATGVSEDIYDMAEGLMTSVNVQWICIGNPTTKRSRFYKLMSDKEWAKIKLTCFDSPNLKVNGIYNKAILKQHVERYKRLPDEKAKKYLKAYKHTHDFMLSAPWVVSKVAKWGFDHPLTLSKVFGEFPETSPDALLSLGDIEAAQRRTYEPTKTDRKCLGIDPARLGTDDTVFTGLHGKQQIYHERFSKFDEVEVAGFAVRQINEQLYDVVIVDETGTGGGVVTNLRHSQKWAKIHAPHTQMAKVEIRGIMFGESKSLSEVEDPIRGMSPKDEFYNQKARMFAYLKTDIKDPNGLCLFDESAYQEQLPMIKVRYEDKTGRLYIESKDEFKKNFSGVSPDDADSLALANLGRYDELKSVGKFSNDYANNDRGTLAGGYKSRKDY